MQQWSKLQCVFDDDGHDSSNDKDDDHEGDDGDDDEDDDDDDLGGRQAWLTWPMELLVNTNLLMSCAIIMMITIDDNIQIFALIFFHSCAKIFIMRIMMTYVFLMMMMMLKTW